jgi:hypothetical protein
MGRQATEDVLEVGEGVDAVVLASAGQGVEDHRRTAAAVAPREDPVAAADCLGAEYPLGEIVHHVVGLRIVRKIPRCASPQSLPDNGPDNAAALKRPTPTFALLRRKVGSSELGCPRERSAVESRPRKPGHPLPLI